jgi:chemotaxis protein MotB
MSTSDRTGQVPPRRQKRPRAEEHANHERWLVSYADFMTLMFAFFTTLYAISTVDAKKLSSMVESMQVAFDPKAAASAQVLQRVGKAAADASKGNGPTDQIGLGDLEKRLTARLAKAIGEHQVEIERDPRGLVISIRESGSFAAGSTDLSGPAQALLGDLSEALIEVSNQVLIEGHTDDIPIRTARFASNWELSTARATRVIAYLLEHSAIQPERLSAAGYAEYHPHAPNASPETRARNRRVDIVIVKPDARAAGPPGRNAQ